MASYDPDGEFENWIPIPEVPDYLQGHDLSYAPVILVHEPTTEVIGVVISQDFFQRAMQVLEDLDDLVAIVKHQDEFSQLAKMLQLLQDGELWGETDLRREFGVN